jgi:hypothetical protein
MALLQKAYLGATPLFRNEDWFQGNKPFIQNVAQATVTASSTTHTKGAWTEIIASTSVDCSLLCIAIAGVNINNTNTASLLDIGTGASGSETAIISNVAVGGAAGSDFTTPIAIAFEVPFKIASGTRISARMQSLVASRTGVVRIAASSSGDYATAPTAVDVIGPSTATSDSVALTGLTTYAQVTASTSQAYRAIAVVPSLATATASSATETMTVAVGASGSEVDFATLPFRRSSTEFVAMQTPYLSLFARNIPSGSRLAVKGSASGNGVQCTLIGIP